MEISEIRDGINEIDEQMMELFQRRMVYAHAIGEIKRQSGAAIFVAEREEEILDKHGKGAFSRRFMRELMEISRCLQTKIGLKKNIVLIGMPGSGKSTIGRILAEFLDVEWVDTDSFVEEKQGKPIIEIFAEMGERAFREMETDVVREAMGGDAKVVSTGGGVVTNAENMRIIGEAATVFFIDRPIGAIRLDIDTSTRPLLAESGALERLYDERIELYREYADYTIGGNLCPIAAARGILRELQS